MRTETYTCACCSGASTFVIGAATEMDRYPGEAVPVRRDGQGRYWCGGCWGRFGNKVRRLDKLRAVAQDAGATEPERENARRRIFELVASLRLPAVSRPAPGASAADATMADALADLRRQEVRRRRFVVFLQAAVLQWGGWGLGYFTKGFEKTHVFWSALGLGGVLVGSWFMFKPDEKRITMVQAIFFVLCMAVLVWVCAPFEVIVCRLVERLA